MSDGAMPAMLMVGIIILIFLLLGACAIIAFLFLSPAQGQGAVATPGGNGTHANGSNASGGNGTISLNTTAINVSGDDMALWDSITLKNVETACLLKAKEEAGSSSGMVYACDCVESSDAMAKTYTCSIDTADPFTEYFANIGCSLEKRTCTVETNYGKTDVTFAELREYFTK